MWKWLTFWRTTDAAQAQKAADYILDRKAPEAVKAEDKAAEKVEEMAAAV